MKFDTPATTNPIDQLKVIGHPVERIDGPLKTTGRAPYAYERNAVAPNAAYGYVVGSAIAKGRIAAMHLDDARRSPGVIAIVTAANAGKLGKGRFNTAKLLGGPEIEHYHQAIAVVVAETFEEARAAADLVRVDYVREDGRFDLAAAKGAAVKPDRGAPDTAVGDFEGAFAAAPVQLDATYSTPVESHAMMEPHASIAAWEGDKLTVWTSNQMIHWSVDDVSATLGIPSENVRLELALHRRRVRLEALCTIGRDPCRAWRQSSRAARKAGAASPLHFQQHHPSCRDDPTHPHRRGAGRKNCRDRSRELVGQSAGRQAGERGRTNPASLRGSEPHDRDAARDTRSSRRQRDARAGRGARHSWRSKSRWTKWRRSCGWTRSSSVC